MSIKKRLLQIADSHDYNGNSYWKISDMDNLLKQLANKVNAIPLEERAKLQKEFKKYNHSVSFMPKYTKGLKKNDYPTDINDLISSPEYDTFSDEDELWDVIEDLIKLNEFMDNVDIDTLEIPQKKVVKREHYTELKTADEFATKYNFSPIVGIYIDVETNKITRCYNDKYTRNMVNKCKSSMPMYEKPKNHLSLSTFSNNKYLNIQKINGKYNDVVYQICDEGELSDYVLIEVSDYDPNHISLILSSKYDYENIYKQTEEDHTELYNNINAFIFS